MTDTCYLNRRGWLRGTGVAIALPSFETLSADSPKTEIREQLEKHREVATCAQCHRKIDPLGFALENFDAIGGWRDRYANELPVDSSGKLPNGDAFATVSEFRELLLEREDQFNRCSTEKLMTYALGRTVEVSDRPVVDQILNELKRRTEDLAI